MLNWVSDDFRSYPFRFCVEVFAWIVSVGCSITMALTVPNPPLFYIYPFWIMGCSMYAWAAFSRRSFGMLANYILLASIDIFGFTRMLG